jgi:hypothetical protein
LTCISVSFGIARAGGGVNDDFSRVLKENIQIVLISIVYNFSGFLWVNYIVIFVKNENEKTLTRKINLQEEVSNVMDNLDEIIISKSFDHLSFCNKKGDKVLENI